MPSLINEGKLFQPTLLSSRIKTKILLKNERYFQNSNEKTSYSIGFNKHDDYYFQGWQSWFKSRKRKLIIADILHPPQAIFKHTRLHGWKYRIKVRTEWVNFSLFSLMKSFVCQVTMNDIIWLFLNKSHYPTYSLN